MEQKKLPDHLIDDFIMGRLNKEDTDTIRQRMKSDRPFAEKVKLRREMIHGVEAFGRKELKNQLKDIHHEVIGQPAAPVKRRRLFPVLAAVAAVLLLLLLLPWLINGGDQSPEKLAGLYFEHHQISIAQRNGAEAPQLLTLEKLYNAKNYQEALPLFEQSLNQSQASHLLLGAGISYLQTGQAEKALPLFRRIIENDDFNYIDQARWYSALAQLSLNDGTAAKAFLQPLAEDTSADHHDEAKELIEKLVD